MGSNAVHGSHLVISLMVFWKLTRHDGKPVYISETGIAVDPAIETMPGRTRITIGGMPHYVTESIDEVLQRIGAKVDAL